MFSRFAKTFSLLKTAVLLLFLLQVPGSVSCAEEPYVEGNLENGTDVEVWEGEPAGNYRLEGDEDFFRGEVLDVRVIEEGEAYIRQSARVEITSGAFSGYEVEVENYYEEHDAYTFLLEEGKEIILVNLREGGFLEGVRVHDVARDHTLYMILAGMAVLLVLVGGWKGFRGLITLTLTLLFIVYILLPLVLRGYHPLLISVISALILIALILLVIGGINPKSFVAIVGTACGVVAAGLLALWAGSAAQLTGFGSEEAQMLYYMEGDINVRHLLFAGIIIGALGAVTDVGISVASAAEEIKQADPYIRFMDLFKSSFNVGRDVMATMSNTIILAYVGAAIPLLLLLIGMETPWLEVINMDLIATEIVRSVAVTMGFIVTVPVTALLAGYVMSRDE